ncbi:MAG: hypothetical protein ACK5OX_16590 [Desertimonas sp.]
MPVIPPVSFDEVVESAQTGDVLLFHGTSPISQAVEVVTMGYYSHAAMIVRDEALGGLLLWQTDDAGIAEDPFTHSTHAGAQLGTFETELGVILAYGDFPYYRRLCCERTPAFHDTIRRFIEASEGMGFGTPAEMLFNWLAARLGRRTVPKDEVFCSELLTMTYQAVGLVGDEHPPDWYSPNSWAAATQEVVLAAGASLEVDVAIDPSTIPVPPKAAPTA